MRGTVSDIYVGDPLDATELAESTRVAVTTPWGLLGGAELSAVVNWLAGKRRLDTHTLSGATVAATLDPYAFRALVYLDAGADFTITNAAALPIGYEVIIDTGYGGEVTIHVGDQEGEYPISCRVTILKTEAARWIATSVFHHANEGPPA